MKPKPVLSRLTRRRFLLTGAGVGAGLLTAAGIARQRSAAAAVRGDANPFAYSVARFEETDPGMLHYAETARLALPWKEPRRLALTAREHLLVAADRCLGELAPDGTVLREIALDADPRCVAVDEDGTLYVGFRRFVLVLDPGGRRQAVWEVTGGRSWISGLALAGDDVFVADSGQRVILRYDRSGRVLGRIGERDRDRDIAGLVLPSPYLDVKWHPDGLLRVNNPGRHRVEFYTPEGKLEFHWGRPSAALEGFSGCCNPIRLEVLEDGRVMTGEKGLPRVKIYSAHGDLESVVAGVESFPENARSGAGGGFNEGVYASLDMVAASTDRVWVLDNVTATVRRMERQPDRTT